MGGPAGERSLSAGAHHRFPILYLAPWVDIGGTDKGTIDWFRWIDRGRFQPSLVTTQPSLNRRLSEIVPYADEVWPLPEIMRGEDFPLFILNFIHSRGVRVLHLMNSRLAFDLLPDIKSLPHPPAVVVQLHVEEQDRSGYVRYVTTRYGNLVDAFSVTSRHLEEKIIRDYGMPRGKCHVIYTGVDAAREFSPERVRPLNGLEPDVTHILYPGRLVEQKDPMLMVEVAAALRDTGVPFRIHVIGEGHLESDLQTAVNARGLDRHVLLHGAVTDTPRWFAATDIVLMTSNFEGVPYVVFEAMAMGVPIVAPALPGVIELMDRSCGAAISPRDDAEAYAQALGELATSSDRARELGEEGRSRVRERFSLQEMAAAHCALYEDLLVRTTARTNGAAAAVGADGQPDANILFHTRPSRESPLVSVIVPCFEQGHYLAQCLDSVHSQTYPNVEVIVVDDASSEQETVELMEKLEHDPDVTVVKLAENMGPSAARNVGLAHARGRYVLPVDADNLLLPDAIKQLVDQLQGAGERIGFVYPNLQYFGNRKDYFEAPAYNLFALLNGNFCDTSSLVDRTMFDAGVRYADDIRLGHEDWDFALQLGARKVYGEPARTRTLLYRKYGFSRSDTVEYGAEAFHSVIKDRHPRLYESLTAIKARWSPALSVVALETVPPEGEARERLEQRIRAQTCSDFEVLTRSDLDWGRSDFGPCMRRLPAGVARSAGEALAHGLSAARGRYVLATRSTGSELFADPTFTEKVLRTFAANQELGAIAFGDAGVEGRFPYRLLRSENGIELEPHSVVWSIDPEGRRPDLRARGDPIAAITRIVCASVPTQWRHIANPLSGASATDAATREGYVVALDGHQPARSAEAAERDERLAAPPLLPSLPSGSLRRIAGSLTWVPPETQHLCRHCDRATHRRVVTNQRTPPPGYALERDLGTVKLFPFQGTAPLEPVEGPEGLDYRVGPEAEQGSASALGYVELAPLPMLDPLQLGLHRGTGERMLVCGDDPLRGEVEPIATLGWIEPFPINPRLAPRAYLPYGPLLGLLRAVDRRRRRHVYGAGSPPPGEVAGELGSLHMEPEEDRIPVWIEEERIPVWITERGELVTDRYRPQAQRPSLRLALRWTLAPAAWRGFATPAARARAVAGRSLESVRALIGRRPRSARPDGPPVGYLYREPSPVHLPLYAGSHPVLADQLLSSWPLEIADMGYGGTTLLGYIAKSTPVTGRLGTERISVPWASKFGQATRIG
jgi:glycosyltransferase involved in cell wall biosynthesis